MDYFMQTIFVQNFGHIYVELEKDINVWKKYLWTPVFKKKQAVSIHPTDGVNRNGQLI